MLWDIVGLEATERQTGPGINSRMLMELVSRGQNAALIPNIRIRCHVPMNSENSTMSEQSHFVRIPLVYKTQGPASNPDPSLVKNGKPHLVSKKSDFCWTIAS